jgi:hypothetical protein
VGLPDGFSLWHASGSLRTAVGYHDNVALSSFAPQGSGFESVEGEVLLARLPYENWQVNLIAAGHDTRFFDSSAEVDAEQSAAVTGQFSWFPHNDWRTITTAEYSYVNQVTDVSATYGTAVRAQVLGHGLTLRQGVRADLGPWFAEAAASGSRFDFKPPLDDYWQSGPNVNVGRYYGRRSEIAAGYSFLPLDYETRTQVSAEGLPLLDTRLRYSVHNAEVNWQHYWDEKRIWRTSARLSLERSTDNGTGYYDYWYYRVTAQVRFRPPGWEVSARAGLGYYDFDRQPLDVADLRTRHRTSVSASVRAARHLGKHWRLFATYEFQQSLSNLEADRYAAHSGSGGLEFEF